MATTRTLLTIIALALAPACGGGGGGSGTVIIEDDPVGATESDGAANGGALADQSYQELVGNDYLVQIGLTATILASLNDASLNEADVAVGLVRDGDILAMANDEAIDHDDANAELDGVLRLYGVGYFPSDTADSIAAAASFDVAAVRAASDPDFTYTDSQVYNHARAQVVLDQLYDVVGPGDMGNFILDMRSMTDSHLALAESLLATFY